MLCRFAMSNRRNLGPLPWILAAIAPALAGCGSPGPLPEVDCTQAVPRYSETTMFRSCVICHSSEVSGADRQKAPTKVNFDTYEAAAESAEGAARLVYNGKMPPEADTVTEGDKELIFQWSLCGTPE